MQSLPVIWYRQGWWLTSEIPATGKLREEDCCEFNVSIDYKLRFCLKTSETDTWCVSFRLRCPKYPKGLLLTPTLYPNHVWKGFLPTLLSHWRSLYLCPHQQWWEKGEPDKRLGSLTEDPGCSPAPTAHSLWHTSPRASRQPSDLKGHQPHNTHTSNTYEASIHIQKRTYIYF